MIIGHEVRLILDTGYIYIDKETVSSNNLWDWTCSSNPDGTLFFQVYCTSIYAFIRSDVIATLKVRFVACIWALQHLRLAAKVSKETGSSRSHFRWSYPMWPAVWKGTLTAMPTAQDNRILLIASAALIGIAFFAKPFLIPLRLKRASSFVLKCKDVEVHISALGGIIQRLFVPDKAGNRADIVLGHASLVDYLVCSYRLLQYHRSIRPLSRRFIKHCLQPFLNKQYQNSASAPWFEYIMHLAEIQPVLWSSDRQGSQPNSIWHIHCRWAGVQGKCLGDDSQEYSRRQSMCSSGFSKTLLPPEQQQLQILKVPTSLCWTSTWLQSAPKAAPLTETNAVPPPGALL